MGNGRVFRCEKCNNGSILMVGVGAGFPDEYKEVIKDIKNGVYGENYKEKLLSRKDIAVDLETNLYVCDKCGDWNVNYCFDFYIPKSNICIEYDGMQHYQPIEHFGGEERQKEDNIRDNIKTEYCKNNNIKLIRISYLDFEKIEEILKQELNLK